MYELYPIQIIIWRPTRELVQVVQLRAVEIWYLRDFVLYWLAPDETAVFSWDVFRAAGLPDVDEGKI